MLYKPLPIDMTTFSAAFPPNAGLFLARLARWGAAREPTSSNNEEAAPQNAWQTLTPAMLRTALLELGVATTPENLQLAQAFTQIGLQLTATTLSQAHVALAEAQSAAPLSYVLAKSLNLPTTPDILRALSTVTTGIPARRALPLDVMEWLGLAVHAGEDTETLAGQISLLINQRALSTERRLSQADISEADTLQDSRSMLLRLALSAGDKQIRSGADTLASHIEGQQLINLAAHSSDTIDGPIGCYFALPLQLPGEQSTLEMNVWRRSESEDDSQEEADTEEPSWRTAVRLATSRLGRIEAALAGTTYGSLTCRIGAEKSSTVRLLLRSREKLAGALATAGWPGSQVTCLQKTEWPPLWFGGEALASPRSRMDWKV